MARDLKSCKIEKMLDRKFISEIRLKEEIPAYSYLKRLPMVQFFERGNTLLFDTSVTFFVGDNGAGKSTLLEALAVARGFNPEGGGLGLRAHNFSTADTHSDLHRYLRIVRGFSNPKDGWFLRAESYYNSLTYLGEAYDFKRDFHCHSHGEVFLERISEFRGNGLYLFDEPEAALSPARLMTLMCTMRALEEKNSQFIIATHSPILMAFPRAKIFYFTESGISEVSFRETEHYNITRRFFDNPEKMFRELFGELF